MKKDLTDIVVILDRSGSMQSVKGDTIGGFNTFLEDQQKAPGEASFTLVQFDTEYERLYDGVGIRKVAKLTEGAFVPRGSTALLDAIGRTIDETGKRLEKLPEGEKPEKIVVVILTDGEENASRKYTLQEINDKITHQRDVYKWEFVFLGANQDAIATASSMNIPVGSSITYAANSMGVNSVFTSASSNVRRYRGGVTGQTSFDAEDYEKQKEAGVKGS